MSIPNGASSPNARNLSVVKMYFKKPMMLIIAILSLATLLLNVVTSAQMSDLSNDILSQLNNGEAVASTSGGGSNALSYLISGIVVICLFLIYFMSNSGSGSPSPFFTVLHIFSVVELVLSSLGALLILVFFLVFIISSQQMVTFVAQNVDGFSDLNPDEISRVVSSFRITLVIVFVLTLAVFAVVLCYINAQTKFLKSCKRSCKEPSLFSQGANTYGNLSMVVALIQLVGIVIMYLVFNSAATGGDDLFSELGIDLSGASLGVPIIGYYLCNAVGLFLRGTFAKGWVKFSAENQNYVYAAAAAATRSPEANPIATYKATSRRSNDAIKQSQPYLYGEEDNKDPNKKSSYIPEELQNDYPPQYDQGGMMGDPFMGDPFAQPMQGMPQDPFAADPFADPFAQSPMGNPYGQPPMDPNGQNPYNNGMM